MTESDYEQIFYAMIKSLDNLRFDMQGGYPSDCAITEEYYIMADVDHDGGPSLSIWRKTIFNKEVDVLLKAWELKSYDEFVVLSEEDTIEFFLELEIPQIYDEEK